MKKIIALISSAAVIISCSSVVMAKGTANTPVLNGVLGGNWTVLAEDKVDESEAYFELTEENVFSGKYALKLAHPKTESDTIPSNSDYGYRIGVTIPVSLTVGTKYLVSFKSTAPIQAMMVNQNMYFGQGYGWTSGCFMYSGNPVRRDAIGNTGWYQNALNYTANSTKFIFSLSLRAGVFPDRYYDDFEIRPYNSDGSLGDALDIPNADFEFSEPAIKDVQVEKNVVSWTESDSYDFVNVYEKDAKGKYSLSAELPYPENVYTAEVTEGEKTYYFTTVTGGVESLEIPVSIVPDMQISEISVKNEDDTEISNLEAGNLRTEISIENNHLENPIKAQLIAVLYKNNSVIKTAASEAVTIEKNGNTSEATKLSADITVPSLEDGKYRLEVFVWDSFKTMNIVKKSVILK